LSLQRRLPLLAVALVIAMWAAGGAVVPVSAIAAVEAGPTCQAIWTIADTPNPGVGDNVLEAIVAVSVDDVWAVGRHAPYPYQTLTEHWDGDRWSEIPSPDVGSGSNFLLDVAATGPSDVWAVGYSTGEAEVQSLIIHWDGVEWSAVPAPHVGKNSNFLYGVSATGPDDAWSVGDSITTRGLALHWNGTRWSVVPTPDAGSLTALSAVEAISSEDVWAVGGADVTGFLHWDGSQWTFVPGPDPRGNIQSLEALGSDEVWAAGYGQGSEQGDVTLTERWDGTSWTIVPSPNIGVFQNYLSDVAGTGSDDVWAVGNWYSFQQVVARTLALHWDGFRWTVVDGPTMVDSTNSLLGVAADPSGTVWAAGYGPGQAQSLVERICPALVTDSGFDPQTIHSPGAGGVAWRFDPANMKEHSIADASGLGLFDSGLREPGSSFTFSYPSAGSYRVEDSTTGAISLVEIGLHADPRHGQIDRRFDVVWGSHGMRPGLVIDVQIRRPGSGSFEDWLPDLRTGGAKFVPDGGPGQYAFRARVRDTDTGAASAYSPPVSILVGEG
jgi:hypothetical protein